MLFHLQLLNGLFVTTSFRAKGPSRRATSCRKPLSVAPLLAPGVLEFSHQTRKNISFWIMLASKPTSINHLWTSWSETCGLIWSDGLHIFCHNGKWMEINMIVSLGCWLEARCKRCSVEVTLWHPDSIYSTQSMQTVVDRMKAKQTVLNCFEMFYAFGHHTNLTIEFGPMSPHSNLTRRWITATSWRVC